MKTKTHRNARRKGAGGLLAILGNYRGATGRFFLRTNAGQDGTEDWMLAGFLDLPAGLERDNCLVRAFWHPAEGLLVDQAGCQPLAEHPEFGGDTDGVVQLKAVGWGRLVTMCLWSPGQVGESSAFQIALRRTGMPALRSGMSAWMAVAVLRLPAGALVSESLLDVRDGRPTACRDMTGEMRGSSLGQAFQRPVWGLPGDLALQSDLHPDVLGELTALDEAFLAGDSASIRDLSAKHADFLRTRRGDPVFGRFYAASLREDGVIPRDRPLSRQELAAREQRASERLVRLLHDDDGRPPLSPAR